MSIKPTAEDYDLIQRKYGTPQNEREQAEHYRRAQAHALIRAYNHGRPALSSMRELDRLRKRSD